MTPPLPRGKTMAQALLTPTRIYVKSLLKVLRKGTAIKALAHITGGGFTREHSARAAQGHGGGH